jgi:hypothetical protein
MILLHVCLVKDPGLVLGGIAGHTNADQTSEGPSLKTGVIAGSAVTGKGIKSKSFRESGHAMLVLALQNFARVVSLSSLNKLHFRYFRTTVDSNFFHGPIEFEIMRVNCRLKMV